MTSATVPEMLTTYRGFEIFKMQSAGLYYVQASWDVTVNFTADSERAARKKIYRWWNLEDSND